MLNRHTLTLFLLLVMVAMFGSTATAKQNKGQNPPAESLTAEEQADLIHLREEEKLARDVYRHLFDTWGQWVFDNIATSEQRHMDAVKTLLDRYDIEDPVGEDVEGVFVNEDLQSLYDFLTVTGDASDVKSLWVGATIEDLDIYDLQHMLEHTTKADLISTYENLLKGSRNHLRSFWDLLSSMGETYEAQYLTQDAIDAIVNSPKETGAR